jgi:hypothetical protein
MVSRFVVLVALVLASFQAFSQDEPQPAKPKKKSFKPDIPGSILIEFGFNVKTGYTPPDFQKSFWGSRTVNIYYQYPIRLFKSGFSINPGIGLSLERWKFTNNYALATEPLASGQYPLVPATTIVNGSIDRSFLVNNYLDMPIELRWDTKPDDIARSINLSFGGRIGVLYDSFSKIDYSENGESKSLKEKQWHGMKSIRYGLYGRAGIGGFSIFMYYNMSPMFEPGKGPNGTQMSSATIGISINGF